MSLHLVTGYKGQAHVAAEDHGALYAGILGTGEAILNIGEKFKASSITANTVRIYDGELVMQGRHVRIERDAYQDVVIENGTQGMKRHDLIAVRYTKDAYLGVENVEFVVLKGAETKEIPADPTPTTGDILSESCLLHEMPLYRVKLNGINVEAVELLVEVLPTFKEYIEAVKSVKYGGTGATTAAEARTNLELGSVATENVVPAEKGGTGQTTIPGALKSMFPNSLSSGNVVLFGPGWDNNGYISMGSLLNAIGGISAKSFEELERFAHDNTTELFSKADTLTGDLRGLGVAFEVHTHNTLHNNGYSLLQANNGNVYSQADTGTADLGVSTKRWKTIYAANALNTSSDIRLKENIDYDMDKYIAMVDLLSPMSYNWIAEKDDPDRKRNVSYGAQYVWMAMKKVGLEEKDFGGFRRDIQEEGPAYSYSLALEQFVPILHARQDRDKAELKTELESVKKELAELRALLVKQGTEA